MFPLVHFNVDVTSEHVEVSTEQTEQMYALIQNLFMLLICRLTSRLQTRHTILFYTFSCKMQASNIHLSGYHFAFRILYYNMLAREFDNVGFRCYLRRICIVLLLKYAVR